MFNHLKISRDLYQSEEHQMLKEVIQQYFKQHIEPFREEWEEQGHVDKSAWLKAGELGLLNIDLPEEYGGGGLDFSFSSLLVEEFARLGAAAPGISMHSGIVAHYIAKYGSEDIKRKYLPPMAKGECIGSLGMTEPSTGSDVQAIKTNAVDQGDHWLLNGSKTFITIGYTADFCIVACKTRPGTPQEGTSLLLVDASAEGFTKGQPLKKIGLKESDTCELFFDNVKVPKENLIGEEGMGFKYMMMELPRERLIVAQQSIASVEGAIDETVEYVEQRTAFKQPIAAFQNTQFKLAEIATQLQAYQCFIDKCVQLQMEKKLTPETASMAKYGATEMEAKALDECLQLFGGYGYMWEYPIARRYANARVSRIYAGTNEIMKVMISRKLLQQYYQELKAKLKAKKAMMAN
ncbi:MAG: acyl-CoA dehydrogenase family protein [Saprospiraceae bacterium]